MFHLVHALQRCAALPLSEWIVALKDCFCAVAATEAGSSVLPDLEQQSSSFASFAAFKLNHDLASFIVQTLCVMLSTLDSAVALGGTGILISKVKKTFSFHPVEKPQSTSSGYLGSFSLCCL